MEPRCQGHRGRRLTVPLCAGAQSSVRQQIPQHLKVGWFYEVAVEACGVGRFAIVIAPIASESDEVEMRMRIAKSTSQLVAVHAGQADIHERTLRLEFLGRLERRGAITRDGGLMAPGANHQSER